MAGGERLLIGVNCLQYCIQCDRVSDDCGHDGIVVGLPAMSFPVGTTTSVEMVDRSSGRAACVSRVEIFGGTWLYS